MRMGNAHDTHAVAVRNIIDGDIKTVWRVYLSPIPEIADTSRICHSIDGLVASYILSKENILSMLKPNKPI